MLKTNYDKFPVIKVSSNETSAWCGWENIVKELKNRITDGDFTLAIECYHGVYTDDIEKNLISPLKADKVIFVNSYAKSKEKLRVELDYNITKDRVFGIMSHHKLFSFFDSEKLTKAKEECFASKGLTVVYGTGTSLVVKEPNLLVYADMARWEIQMRFRRGTVANLFDDNFSEDNVRKYKRSFFIDWRVLDREKRNLFPRIDYFLDTNDEKDAKLMTSEIYSKALEKAINSPFRVKPYFDPGVWGGHWMQEKFDLDKNKENFAWCFDCVPEENSLLVQINEAITLETPSINLVFQKPLELLGSRVYARFGAEFPIRFDMLDTMGGGNLSLQVHPLTSYIQDNFGMHYTQDESYYLLDVDESAAPVVYLGVKHGVDKEEVKRDLLLAQADPSKSFPAEKYVNAWKARKHDHFLIPSGTVHCSGAGCMVLEISSTPYIFTFKLWDWGRIGLDGKPRPIHIEHGMENIQFDRDTEWVKANLVDQVEQISEFEERTGLHEKEFIETRRYWSQGEKLSFVTNDSVNVLNLVEGTEAVVESPDNSFEPYVIHYAETFIVPENVKTYTIRPTSNEKIGVLRAYVRT